MFEWLVFGVFVLAVALGALWIDHKNDRAAIKRKAGEKWE